MREEETNEIYSKMAIEIMEQMKKGKDITSLVNKDNILSLLEKIKENDSNYYYCYTDLKKGNDIGIANFTKHEKIIPNIAPPDNPVSNSSIFTLRLSS